MVLMLHYKPGLSLQTFCYPRLRPRERDFKQRISKESLREEAAEAALTVTAEERTYSTRDQIHSQKINLFKSKFQKEFTV